MTGTVPHRNDGFDPKPSGDIDRSQSQGIGGESQSSLSQMLSRMQGMNIPQLMSAFNVDEQKAKYIKDTIAGVPAGTLAGLSEHFLGDLLGEEWAGLIGGAVGGFLGGLMAKKAIPNTGKYRRQSR